MAERRQDNSCGEGCVPNMLVAAYLDRALFIIIIGQQQRYSENVWIFRHRFMVVLPDRKARQDYFALRVYGL